MMQLSKLLLLVTTAALMLLLLTATVVDCHNHTEPTAFCENDAACEASGSVCIGGLCRCKLIGHQLAQGDQCVPWSCKADADCNDDDGKGNHTSSAPSAVTLVCNPTTHLCECDPKKFQLNAEGTECLEAAGLSTLWIVLIVIAAIILIWCLVCLFAIFCCGCTALCCCL